MKRLQFLFLLLSVSIIMRAQRPFNYYSDVNKRYMPGIMVYDGQHVPGYSTVPTIRPGISTASGNIGVDTVNHRFYFLSGGVWRYSTATSAGSAIRFGVSGEDNAAAADRRFSGQGNYQFTFDSLLSFYVKHGNVARIFTTSSATGLSAPDSSAGFNIGITNNTARIYNGSIAMILNSDSVRIDKRISYTDNIHSSFTPYSLVTKKYVDSVLLAAGIDASNKWGKQGDAGTNPATDFIGTTDAQSLLFKVNSIRSGYIGVSDKNTSFGIYSFNSNTIGEENTAVGRFALYANTEGTYNTAVGSGSLQSNTTGNYNTGVGLGALFGNTTGDGNTGIGRNSLFANTTGFYNTAIGQRSLESNTTGEQNFAGGMNALLSNTTGIKNTGVGTGSIENNTTGDFNTGIGHDAMLQNTTGVENIGIGWLGWSQNITGSYNVGVGNSTGRSIVNGSYNTFLGVNAGYGAGQEDTVNNCVAIGINAKTTTSYQMVITDSVRRLTIPGISRGTAGYVLTDSTGDGQYLVFRPQTTATVTGATNLLNLSGGNIGLGGTATNDTYLKGANFARSLFIDSFDVFWMPRVNNVFINSRTPSFVGGFLKLTAAETSLNYSVNGNTSMDIGMTNTQQGGKYFTFLASNSSSSQNQLRVFPDSISFGSSNLNVASKIRFDADGKVWFPHLSTGIPSGAKRLLVGSNGYIYADDTTTGGGSTSPAGSDREIQINSSGVFGASSSFKYNSGGEVQIGSSTDLGDFKLQVTGKTKMTDTVFVTHARVGGIDIGNYGGSVGFQNNYANTSRSGLYFRTFNVGSTNGNIIFESGSFNMTLDVSNAAENSLVVTYGGNNVKVKSGTHANIVASGSQELRLGAEGTENQVTLKGGRVGINSTSPALSAQLDVASTTKGFLPPRMTGAQAEAIPSPAEGLLIYATDGSGTTITSKGWWGWDGSAFVKLN